MMLSQKTDKIVVVPFIRLFTLVLTVTVFIMLMQFFLIWFDELIGKDLGLWIYLQLFCYFGINSTPLAFPLAILVASLMVFGSLGEQLELTALKSAGIPFIRVLQPLLILISLLSIFVYFSNGYIVPKVTVKAHTLFYDLRKKKPSVAIKEGIFYNGIPNYSIRVEKKLPDEKTLQGIIIYDHAKNKGNVHMTTAASGELTTIQGGQYLSIELFDGHNYLEKLPEKDKNNPNKLLIPQFYRISFKSQRVLIDLDAFKLTRTSEKLFTYYHSTKTTREINKEISKMRNKIKNNQQDLLENFQKHYHLSVADSTAVTSILPEKNLSSIDSSTNTSSEPTTVANTATVIEETSALPINTTNASLEPTAITDTATVMEEIPALPIDTAIQKKLPITHNLDKNPKRYQIIQKALSQTRDLKYKLQPQANKITSVNKNLREFQIEKYKRAAYAAGCIIMLLIGASLGALIKKGGLGVPLLISTVFILIYYVMDMFGTKWAKVGMVDVGIGAWAPNLVLLPFGLFFLRQAQKDTRILELDAYLVLWKRIVSYLRYKRKS